MKDYRGDMVPKVGCFYRYMCIWQRCHGITLRYDDLIEPKWHYITPSIQMEFFSLKNPICGFPIHWYWQSNTSRWLTKQEENSYKNLHFIVICNHTWFICIDGNLIYFQLFEYYTCWIFEILVNREGCYLLGEEDLSG